MQPTFPPLSSTGTNLRLGGALAICTGGICCHSLATVIFFSMGMPLYFRGYIDSIDADTLSALQGLGLSTTFYATYQTVLVVLLAIAFSIAGLIFTALG